MKTELEKMVIQYIETGLWASVDSKGIPLDRSYDISDLTLDAREGCKLECELFLALISTLVNDYPNDMSQLGHDLWLTQNRHGAGFWDRGLGNLGDALTEFAHFIGEAYFYVDENNQIGFDRKLAKNLQLQQG